MCICDSRSPALLEGLGWNSAPDAPTLAAQLRALGQKHSSNGGSGGDGSEAISAQRRRALAVAVPQLLQVRALLLIPAAACTQNGHGPHHERGAAVQGSCMLLDSIINTGFELCESHLESKRLIRELLQALSSVPPEQLHGIADTLSDAPVIWTGGGFTSIDRVAFGCVMSLFIPVSHVMRNVAGQWRDAVWTALCSIDQLGVCSQHLQVHATRAPGAPQPLPHSISPAA